MKQLFWLLCVISSLSASAATEAEFQHCAQLKDLTVAIAEQADKGVTRVNLKGKLSSRAMDDLIDWVYDFRGAYSTQQMAQKQLDICLQHFHRGKMRQ